MGSWMGSVPANYPLINISASPASPAFRFARERGGQAIGLERAGFEKKCQVISGK